MLRLHDGVQRQPGKNVPLVEGFIAEGIMLFGIFYPHFNFIYLIFSLFLCWAGKIARSKNLRRFKAA